MLPLLTREYANPSGAHAESRRARVALDDARDRIAELLGAGPGDVCSPREAPRPTTSASRGGGTRWRPGAAPPAIRAHSSAPPWSTMRSSRRAGRWPAAPAPSSVRSRATGGAGVDLDALAGADARGPPGVGHGRQQRTRDRQPLADVARAVREAIPRAVLHTDAVQAVPWLDWPRSRLRATWCRSAPTSSGGPRGPAPWCLRQGAGVRPRIGGGGQERGRRSGTPNVRGRSAWLRPSRPPSPVVPWTGHG